MVHKSKMPFIYISVEINSGPLVNSISVMHEQFVAKSIATNAFVCLILVAMSVPDK